MRPGDPQDPRCLGHRKRPSFHLFHWVTSEVPDENWSIQYVGALAVPKREMQARMSNLGQ